MNSRDISMKNLHEERLLKIFNNHINTSTCVDFGMTAFRTLGGHVELLKLVGELGLKELVSVLCPCSIAQIIYHAVQQHCDEEGVFLQE